MNMEFIRKLPIPMDIKAQYPLSDEMKATKERRDEEIKAIFEGKSNKFILIIGPCSADNEISVLDYIERLRKVQEKVADKISAYQTSKLYRSVVLYLSIVPFAVYKIRIILQQNATMRDCHQRIPALL